MSAKYYLPTSVVNSNPSGAVVTAIDDYPSTTADYFTATQAGISVAVKTTQVPTSYPTGITKIVAHAQVKAPAGGTGMYGYITYWLAGGGATSAGAPVACSAGASTDVSVEVAVNPFTGVAWTLADLVNFQWQVDTGNFNGAWYVYDMWLEVVFADLAQVTLDALALLRDNDGQHVLETAIASLHASGELVSLRWQIAADSAGSTVLADSQTVATTAIEGQTLTRLHTWTPTVSGAYWLRVGIVCTDHPTVYWQVVSIVISIPTLTSVTVVQSGEYLVATCAVSDATCSSGMMFYAGGDGTNMEREGNTMKARLWVSIGDISWSIVIVTPWAVLSTQGVIVVHYTPQSGIHIYQDDAELDVSNPTLEQPLIPDVPKCRFTTTTTLDVLQEITVKAAGKRCRMAIQSIDNNDDGSCSVTCVDRGHAVLSRPVSIAVAPTTAWGVASQLRLRWAADYGGLLTTPTTDTVWANTPVSTILEQLALLAGVSFALWDGVMYVLPQTGEPVAAVSKGRQRDLSRMYNHIREEYVIADYPSPASYLSLFPTLWTGTVDAAAYVTVTRLPPPSKASAWLHATGTIYTTQVGAVLTDYDRFRMTWTPSSSAASITVKLEQDASNYLTRVIPFAGSMATGWVVAGNSSSDVVTHIYAVPGTYVGIALQFDAPCSVRVREVVGGVDAYVTEWQSVGTEEYTITLNNSLQADSLIVEVTQLHIIDTAYGIRCVKATLLQQTIQSLTTGSAMKIVWSAQTTTPIVQGKTNYAPQPPQILPGDVYEHDVRNYQDAAGKWWTFFYGILWRRVATTQQVPVTTAVTVTETAPLQQDIDLALSDFVVTGNPINLTKVTITATGEHWYDSPSLVNTRKTRKSVDVYADGWTLSVDNPWIRTTDQWRNPDVARAFATALLAVYSLPLAQYIETVDWNSPVQLGDIVTTQDGDLVVNAVTWDAQSMTKTVRVGQRVRDTLEWMQGVNSKISDLERMV